MRYFESILYYKACKIIEFFNKNVNVQQKIYPRGISQFYNLHALELRHNDIIIFRDSLNTNVHKCTYIQYILYILSESCF